MRLIRIICERNIEGGLPGGKCQPSSAIHPSDDALVGKTVVTVIIHADNDMLVDFDPNNFRRPDDFLGDGDVIGGRFEIVGGMVVGKG